MNGLYIPLFLGEKNSEKKQDLAYFMYNDEDPSGLCHARAKYLQITFTSLHLSHLFVEIQHALQSNYFSLTTTVMIFFFSGSQWLTKGIAKGVLMFNNFTGFWLIHSVPGFPPFSERGYDYPQSGRTRGHVFFCVSVNVVEIDAIGSLFLYNMPHFYDWYIPAAMTTWIPNLMSVLHGMRYSYFHINQ